MKPGLLVLLSLLVLAAAMVPRHRRAMDNKDRHPPGAVTICAKSTPCAWTVYKPLVKIVEFSINNTYCTCGVGTVCEKDEEDHAASTYVYRCRTPKPTAEPES